MSAGIRGFLARWIGGANAPVISGLTGDTILCDPMTVSAFIAPMETDLILPMLTDVIAAMTALAYVAPMVEDAHVQPMLIRCKD